MIRYCVHDVNRSLGYGCCKHKGSRLNAIRNHCMIGSAQFAHTFDFYGICACPLDLCSHLVEEIGKIDNFRLLCSVFKICGSFSQHSRHHDIFRSTYARKVQINSVSHKTLTSRGRFDIIIFESNHGTEGFQPLKMQIYRSCSYSASARMRNAGNTLSCKQRSHYQNRCSHLIDQFKAGFC